MIWFSHCILSLYFLTLFINLWFFLYLLWRWLWWKPISWILYVIFFTKFFFLSFRNFLFIDWVKWADKRHRVSTLHMLYIHLLTQDSVFFCVIYFIFSYKILITFFCIINLIIFFLNIIYTFWGGKWEGLHLLFYWLTSIFFCWKLILHWYHITNYYYYILFRLLFYIYNYYQHDSFHNFHN